MTYLGTQPNDVKKNTGLYTPSEILQLEKDGHWGGSLELIEEQTVSGVGTIDFTNIKENVYDVHFLSVSNYHTTADSGRGVLRFYESGVLESAGVYQVAEQQGRADGVFSEVRSTTSTSLRYIISTGNATNESGNAYCYIYNAGNSSKYTFMTYQTMSIQAIPQGIMAFGGGVLPQASLVDGFQISGTGITATAKLYGVKQ